MFTSTGWRFLKKIYLKNRIAFYKIKGWHSDIVDAYEKYINGDSSSKDIIEKHYKRKTIIWEGSIFDNYLSKYATNKTKQSII